MNKKLVGWRILAATVVVWATCPLKSFAAGYTEIGQYGRPGVLVFEIGDTEEQIQEEIRLGDMELMAQLVEAEAGNQPFKVKCRVVDVLLNRIESDEFPNTVEGVIFQSGQFSVTTNGAWEKAAWNMQESDFAAVAYEIEVHENKDYLYFNNSSKVGGSGTPDHIGDLWFNTD